MRRGVVLAGNILADGETEEKDVTDKKPLTAPSFPKAADEWGYTGSRVQGPSRAFSTTGAKPCEEHVALPRQLPFPTGNGHHVLPMDARAAVRFITERGPGDIKVSWMKRLAKNQAWVRILSPNLRKICPHFPTSRKCSPLSVGTL